jgi:hypothetical protein
VLAEGGVDIDRLKAVLDAVDVGDPAEGLSLRLRSLPGGYAEIVAPRSLGIDARYHRTLAGEHWTVGISETSDWNRAVALRRRGRRRPDRGRPG